MRKTILVALLTGLTLTGCGSPTPNQDEKRQEACAAFESLTPGSLELQEAIDVLSDEDASTSERQAALKRSLDQQSSANRRTTPYDCEQDRDLFERNFGPFE